MTPWVYHFSYHTLLAWTGVYIALTVGHFAAQLIFAVANNHTQHRANRPALSVERWPTVAVVVPVYNETPHILDRCLQSIVDQDYPHLGVYAVDDGSPNRHHLQPVYTSHPTLEVVLLDSNVGKRCAQKAVFDSTRADIYVTVDSDTVLDPGSLRTLITPLIRNPNLGAVTGDVKALNRNQNLLTRLIALRYWNAFHLERAAQSLFGVVACCSGPYTAYRGDLIQAVKNDYVNERFLGQRCTFGDDRHLTNLILRAGVDIQYNPDAVAHTHVPHTIPTYLRQQTRWSKSSIRETIWTFRHVRHRHPWLYIDLALQALLPFFLLAIIANVAHRAITHNWTILAAYIAIIALVGLARSLYGLISTRQWGFLLFALYGYLNMLLLVPTRLYALATLNRTHWGTRGKTR